MTNVSDGGISRRGFMTGGPHAAAAAAVALAGASTPARQAATALVSADGDAAFGPQTPGTSTGGIQEAIDAVHDEGGGVVLLKSGVHTIEGSHPPPAAAIETGPYVLYLREGVTLRGEGMYDTTIRSQERSGSNMILAWDESRIGIEDLTIDGQGRHRGYGVAIFKLGPDWDSYSDVLIRRVRSMGVSGSAFGICGGRSVVVDQCLAQDCAIGYELGGATRDYCVLHCTARSCTNGTLIFTQADRFSEAGNLYPRIIGGVYDGGGAASGVALWDCWEPVVIGVTALRGRTTNIQIASTHRESITTPVGGGVIEACLAEDSAGSDAGRYGVGAFVDGVRVVTCTLSGNEDVGVSVRPDAGGQVLVADCTFREGGRKAQKHAIAAEGKGIALHATGNLYQGPRESFLAGVNALDPARSLLAHNAGYNPVGVVHSPDMPASGEYATNPYPFVVEVHVYGGSGARIRKRDAGGNEGTAGVGPCSSVTLWPGEAVALDYADLPQWSWFGL